VRSNFGPITTFELIQPEQIDRTEPSLQANQGGGRGGGSGVASGGELRVDLTQEAYLFVFPGARFSDNHLCAGPDPTLFELRSTTPEVCVIDPDGCATLGCYTSACVPATANILAPGTCTLELEAPTLNHGAGLSHRFTVDIVEE
jgi:hypothetical protein